MRLLLLGGGGETALGAGSRWVKLTQAAAPHPEVGEGQRGEKSGR
ncbi:hypothetical protein [Deinococcus hopiensis]|nr:hypothetical protein [Deinococcus hopiensis]